MKLLDYRKNKCITRETIMVVKRPKENKGPSYVEKLTNKLFLVIALFFLAAILIPSLMTGLRETIVPLYLPIMLINIW